MRLEGSDEANESNGGGGTSGVCLGGGALEGSGAVDGAGARRSRCGSGGAVAVGSLDLAVGDLRSDRSSSAGLDLTVGDLGDGCASGSGGAGLNLAVGDLGDGCAGASLDLTVGDLGDGSTRGAGLRLAVRDLGDGSRDGGLLGLAVRKLRSSAGGRGRAAADNVDGDVAALVALGLVVEVVEVALAGGVASQALVEDGLATKSERAVGASRPASGVDGASLSRAVKLELVVGGDVTGAVLGVGEDTVLEGDAELVGLSLLPLWLFVSM